MTPAPLDPGPGTPGPDPDRGPGSGPDSPLPPSLRSFLRNGLILYPVAVAALIVGTDISFLDALFLVALLELLPVLAVAQVPLVAEEEVIDRPAAYVGSSAVILFLGWTSMILGGAGIGLDAMGLGPIDPVGLLTWSGVALGGALAVVGVAWLLERGLGLDEGPLLRQILPRTRREKGLFVGVAFVAGFGEELAYRAYAIPVLATLVQSSWVAAILSSGTFGFLHAYQGALGIVRTALMGAVLAVVFLLSGSAWPVIVAHVVIDLIGGLIIGPRILEDE